MIGLVVTAWMLSASPTTATATAADAKTAARASADVGARNYQVGAYQAALDAFAEAYRLYPAPKLLFNIGQCHRFLGAYDKAIWAFESFLDAAPDAPERGHVLEMIEKAKLELNGKEAGEKRRREAQERERDALEEAARSAARAEVERQAAERAKEDERKRLVAVRDAPEDEAVYETWWFWTIVGGVAIAATSIVIVGASREPDLILPMGQLGVVDHRTQ